MMKVPISSSIMKSRRASDNRKRKPRRKTRAVTRTMIVPTGSDMSVSDRASRANSEDIELLPNPDTEAMNALAEAAAAIPRPSASEKGKGILQESPGTQSQNPTRPDLDLNIPPSEPKGIIAMIIDEAKQNVVLGLPYNHSPPPLALTQMQPPPGYPYPVFNPFANPSVTPSVVMLNPKGEHVPPKSPQNQNPHYVAPITMPIVHPTVHIPPSQPTIHQPNMNPLPPIKKVYYRRPASVKVSMAQARGLAPPPHLQATHQQPRAGPRGQGSWRTGVFPPIPTPTTSRTSLEQMQDNRELLRLMNNQQAQINWLTRVAFQSREYDSHRDRVWRDTIGLQNRNLLHGLPPYPTLPPLEPFHQPPIHRQ